MKISLALPLYRYFNLRRQTSNASHRKHIANRSVAQSMHRLFHAFWSPFFDRSAYGQPMKRYRSNCV
ncbi:hypothetical protein VN97_g11794 [Penicillium thymicola]|uniref:Uncharacterized protein n=1 Tax=Penicillium thymicola TaxID=293382 RepID=A0AAI9T6K7_PENTH|nr:hypothetical protein VN97_g11794 [Penicillium thymicola]